MRLGWIDVCSLSVSKSSPGELWGTLTLTDTPYENVKEGQDWWKTVDLPGEQKEAVARTNAIRLFKLPLEI